MADRIKFRRGLNCWRTASTRNVRCNRISLSPIRCSKQRAKSITRLKNIILTKVDVPSFINFVSQTFRKFFDVTVCNISCIWLGNSTESLTLITACYKLEYNAVLPRGPTNNWKTEFYIDSHYQSPLENLDQTSWPKARMSLWHLKSLHKGQQVIRYPLIINPWSIPLSLR